MELFRERGNGYLTLRSGFPRLPQSRLRVMGRFRGRGAADWRSGGIFAVARGADGRQTSAVISNHPGRVLRGPPFLVTLRSSANGCRQVLAVDQLAVADHVERLLVMPQRLADRGSSRGHPRSGYSSPLLHSICRMPFMEGSSTNARKRSSAPASRRT